MLTAVVLDNNGERVVKALLDLGVMEFVSVSQLQGREELETKTPSLSKAQLTDLRVRVEAMLSQGGILIPNLEHSDLNAPSEIDVDDERKFLDRLSMNLSKLKDEQKQINQRLLVFNELNSYLHDTGHEYLDLRVGRIGKGAYEDLASRYAIISGLIIEKGEYLVSLTLKRDSAKVNQLLDKFDWRESEDEEEQKAALAAAEQALKAKIETLNEENEEKQAQVKGRIDEKEGDLIRLWKSLRVYELSQEIKAHFSYTKHTDIFSGWVPSDEADEVERLIIEVTGGQCIIEWAGEEELDKEKIPVSLSSPKVLEPFKHLVDNYGTPEYGSINPTIFTTIAYMLMFMLMFADLGQGFVLLMIGLLGKMYYKNHPMAKDGLISRFLCSLLVFLGPASMVGGLLFGSCFGFSWIPALWFNYHAVVNGHASGMVQSIYDILGITIKFGIAVIYTGLVLNWINLFRKKRYIELIFDKSGLVGGFLYFVGIRVCFYFVASGYKSFPVSPALIPAIAIPLLLLIAKGPIKASYEARREGEKKKAGTIVMDTLMDFLVDVLEIFSGYLSNTLSFMRIAGLGIAHVSLMTAFEDMAAMTGNLVFYVLIMIVGNVLVIAIEGLSAGIQSLRLNYYEFFTRYFTGRGIAYSPIGLKSSPVTE